MIAERVLHLPGAHDLVRELSHPKRKVFTPDFVALQNQFGDAALLLLEGQKDEIDGNPLDVRILDIELPPEVSGPLGKRQKEIRAPIVGDPLWRNTQAFMTNRNSFTVYKTPKNRISPPSEVAFCVTLSEEAGEKFTYSGDPAVVEKVKSILEGRTQYLNYTCHC